jgi:cysteine desulfurase
MSMRSIYLDFNATTPVLPEIFNAMKPYLTDKWGNPSSAHWAGDSLTFEIENARENIAKSLKCKKEEIYFTSCGTESNNWAIQMAMLSSKKKEKHIITTKVEHPAVLEPVKFLEKNFNIKVSYINVDKFGNLNLEELKNSINENTVLISTMLANNETGVIFPVKEIGDIAKQNNILFHVDAVQGYGKMEIDLSEIKADFLSISGHKVYSPKGIGALFIRNGVNIPPLLHGGGQERGLRSGTENVASIIALGKSADSIMDDFKTDYFSKLKNMRDYMENKMLEQLSPIEINGDRKNRVVNTSNISFLNIETSALIKALSYEGIAISAGSACASHKESFSHVLAAMGKNKMNALSAVRISLGKGISFEDIEFATNRIIYWVKRLRSFTPEKF